jgi:hypothetical protein
LRDTEIISPREIARAAMVEKDIPETDKATRQNISARFTRVCYELTLRGQLEKIGHGEGAGWKLAPREPDLI